MTLYSYMMLLFFFVFLFALFTLHMIPAHAHPNAKDQEPSSDG